MPRKLTLVTAFVAATGVAAATALVAAPVDAARSSGAAAHRPAAARVLASGLNNPRHLVFRGGTLYVAEAGKGGTRNCQAGPEGGTVCYGATGSIMRLGKHPRRILTGLPSHRRPGHRRLGPRALRHRRAGRRQARLHRSAAAARLLTARRLPASARRIGTLVVASHRGKSWNRHSAAHVADLMRFEARHDPDDQGADSDPTGLIRRGSHFLTTDSGGNDLLRAGGGDPIRVLAKFGNRTVKNPFAPGNVPMQSVPTAVAVGPGGALFVSELTGFPFPQGAARIFRVVPGHPPTVWATGLTNVTDLTWYRGSLYAVQLANTGLLTPGLPVGSLVKVHHGASHTQVGGNLHAPYGVAMRNGAAFVTTCSVCAGGGKVIRMQLP